MESGRCLLDQHIRKALKASLQQLDSTATIIDEMPLLRGRGRADLAFVNGSLCGYEIKSEADSLVRLGNQTQNYEAVFELNTVVIAKKHLRSARQRIPKTWGIIEVRQLDGEIQLCPRRQARRNRNLSKPALARLLWKDECIRILREFGIQTKSNVPVMKLWRLLESLDTDSLCRSVREALKHRPAKAAGPHTLSDDSCTTVAIELDHLAPPPRLSLDRSPRHPC
jgi:hypothetical protein